jgi:cytochrome P450
LVDFLFSEYNLKVVLQDLFFAGTETTSTTLLWAILFLTQNSHVQKKLQNEVDSVIGRTRAANRDDKEKLVN